METFDLVFISSSQTCLLHWLSIRGPAAVKKRIIKVNEESVISVSVWVTTTLLINNQLTLTAEDTHSSSANIKGKVLSNNAALLFHRIEADKNTHTHTSAPLLWNRVMFKLNAFCWRLNTCMNNSHIVQCYHLYCFDLSAFACCT